MWRSRLRQASRGMCAGLPRLNSPSALTRHPQYVPKTDPPQAQEEYITVAGQRFEDQPNTHEPKLRPADDLHSPRRRRRGRRIEDEDLDELDDGYEGDSAGEQVETVDMSEKRRQSLVSQVHENDQIEDDQIAESNPAAGALGPAIGAALANAQSLPTDSPVSPEVLFSSAKGNGLSPADGDRGRHDSGGSVTLVHSSSSPDAPTFPPKVHLSNGTNGTEPKPRTSQSSAAPSYLHFAEPPEDWEPPKRLAVERVPNSAPVLTEQYRYDPREGIVRPYRSHRCRHCAAIVLSA